MVPLTTPAPIPAPVNAPRAVVAAAPAPRTFAPSVATMTGAAVPSALDNVSTGATVNAFSPAKKAAPKRIENRQRKYAEVQAEIEAKKKQLAELPPTPTAPPAPAFTDEEIAKIEAEMEAESAATRAAAPPSEFEAAVAEVQAERAAAPPPPAPPTPPVSPPVEPPAA